LNWIEFTALGLLVTGILWIVGGRKRSFVVRVAAFLVGFSIIALVSYVLTPAPSQGDSEWYRRPPWPELLYFFLMIVGMLARSLSIAIEERKSTLQKLNRGKHSLVVVSLHMDIWDLAYPMLFSVMTFGALLSQIGDAPIGVTSVVLAFQTGFFWQTIIKRGNAGS